MRKPNIIAAILLSEESKQNLSVELTGRKLFELQESLFSMSPQDEKDHERILNKHSMLVPSDCINKSEDGEKGNDIVLPRQANDPEDETRVKLHKKLFEMITGSCSLGFYYGHQEGFVSACKELTEFFKPRRYNVAYYDNYFYSVLQHSIKRKNPQVQRRKINNLWNYSLKPETRINYKDWNLLC